MRLGSRQICLSSETAGIDVVLEKQDFLEDLDILRTVNVGASKHGRSGITLKS